MMTIVLLFIALAFIVGITLMTAQRDDVRVYFLSVNRTIQINNADVRPRVDNARNVSTRRMKVNNNPRM